jgi:hypothetical protein
MKKAQSPKLAWNIMLQLAMGGPDSGEAPNPGFLVQK